MNKAAFLTASFAALAVVRVALAQDQGADPLAPLAVSGAPASTSTDPAQTTTTSAEAPPTPPVAPVPSLRERETLVARQSIRPNRPLLLAGLSTFVGTYATTAALTGATVVRGGNVDRTLYLPLAGPWLHLATVPEGMLDRFLIAGSGVLQGVGVALSVLSVFVPEKIPAATVEARGIKVNLTATSFGKGSSGLAAEGQF